MGAIADAFVRVGLKPDADAARRLKQDMSQAGDDAGKAAGDSAGKGFHGAFGGWAVRTGALMAGAFAGLAVVDFFKDSITEARESEKVNKLTAAAIASTGGAAKVTSEHMGELATRLSNLSGVDDEVIQSGQNVLLTFTGIRNEAGKGNDIFDQTTGVALDMSRALGQDLQSSILQVGKALNDPTKGMTALQRAGVSFTASQKDQIIALQKSGDLMGAQKLILAELTKEFGGAAAAAASPAEKAAVAWANFKEQIGGLLLPVLNALLGFFSGQLIPAISSTVEWVQGRLWPAMQNTWSRIAPLITPVVAAIRDGLFTVVRDLTTLVTEQLWPAMVNTWTRIAPVIVPVAQAIGVGLLGAVRGLWEFLTGNLIPALSATAKWLGDHQVILYMVGGAVGALTAMLVIQNTVTLAVTIATKAWAAAQLLINAALSANPIGLIVVALGALVGGLIYAYTHFEGFRNLVDNAWSVIKQGATIAWGVLQSIFSAIGSAIDFVVEHWKIFAGVLAVILGPIGIVIAGVVLLATHWRQAVDAISAAVQWLWGSVIQPIFNFISEAARILAAVITAVLVIPVTLAFRLLGATAEWLWTSSIKPAFDGIGLAIQFAYATMIKPIINQAVLTFQELGRWATWLWQNVIVPVWDGIGAAIVFVYRNVILPTFNFLVGGIQELARWATWLWQNVIVPVWDGIGAAINFVYRNVVRPTWDLFVAGLQQLAQVATWLWQNVIIPVWDGIGSAIGFVFRNVINPVFDGLKNALHLVGQAFESTTNWIGTAWNRVIDIAKTPVNFVIEKVYNDGIAELWNGIAGTFGLDNLKLRKLARLASGGPVVGEGGPRDDMVPLWGSNGEYMVNARSTAKHFQLIEAINNDALPAYADGGIIGNVGNIIGNVASGVGNFVSSIGDLFSNPKKFLEDKLSGVLGGLGNFGRSPFVQSLTKIPGKFIDAAVNKIKSLFESGIGGGGSANFKAGAGVQQWAPLVLQALAMLGQPPSMLNSVLRRMNQESGGNPNVINNWDSNAMMGIPSQGLMQVIPPTFRAYAGPFAGRGILDPLANIYAGLNYAIHRYPSLSAAMDRPGGYDSGGWLNPGWNYNGTKTPEAVLTESQWSTMRQLAEKATGGGNTTYQINGPDVDSVMAQLERKRQWDLLGG